MRITYCWGENPERDAAMLVASHDHPAKGRVVAFEDAANPETLPFLDAPYSVSIGRRGVAFCYVQEDAEVWAAMEAARSAGER
jgi:hypothetical protein